MLPPPPPPLPAAAADDDDAELAVEAKLQGASVVGKIS